MSQVVRRTVALLYLLEVAYLGLLVVDHRRDLHHFRKVVGFMVAEYKR